MKPVEVLLVEDNPGDILLINQTLSREPFPTSVHVAVDGEQAIRMLAARRFEPDLVILDLNIPKVSGLLVLEQCEADLPVVIFTSSSNPQDRRCALELGAKEFVQKPMGLQAYTQVVSQMVRNWASRESITDAAR